MYLNILHTYILVYTYFIYILSYILVHTYINTYIHTYIYTHADYTSVW